VYNAADDPVATWQYPDGTTGVIIRRLDEVSCIGFQILGDGGGEDSIVVTSFFDVILTFSDAELSTEFAKEVGPGSVTATDVAGPGVRFDFVGLSTSSGTTVADSFAVSALAGGAYKTYGVIQQFPTHGDFTAYTKYRLVFTNVGTSPVNVNLKVNTGWTIPPPEYGASWRDTFWQNTWTYIGPDESEMLTLDFSQAQVYNALDEKEHPQHPDGTTGIAVWRLDEVSSVGFQVLGEDEASIVVSGFGHPPTAGFTYLPIAPLAGEPITFDASGSSANGGTIIEYQWDFDDGNITTTSEPTIVHSFSSLGSYDVSVKVTDVESFFDIQWNLVTVSPSVVYHHDVAITQININATLILPGDTGRIIEKGDVVEIEVTVKNKGNIAESFSINVIVSRYDGIQAGVLPSQDIVNLDPDSQQTLMFYWITDESQAIGYIIRAIAETVPGERYMDTFDNTKATILTLVETMPEIPVLEITPASRDGLVRGYFDLNVTIDNANAFWDVAGFSMKVVYDASVIHAVDVTEGPFLKAFGGTYFVSEIHNDQGFVLVYATQLPPRTTTSGRGTLFTVQFQGFGEGECDITLEETELAAISDETKWVVFTSVLVPYTMLGGHATMFRPLPGDINADGKVNLTDLVLLAMAYGSRPGDLNWNENADLAQPYGVIGLSDLVTVAAYYGQVFP
jgi:PKD repeat protein